MVRFLDDFLIADPLPLVLISPFFFLVIRLTAN
jgi:hypothetical protein